MIFHGTNIDQYVIKKDDNELVEVWTENGIHSGLEQRWCIAQVKGHHLELIMSMVSAKCNFANVILMHTNLMVAL